MAVSTPINGIQTPSSGDDPDFVANFGTMATQVDNRCLPRYANASTRNAANLSPVVGQVAYLIQEKLLTQYRNGSWVVIPRTVTLRKAASEVVNNSSTLQNDDHYFFTADANSTYLVEMRLSASCAVATANLKYAFTIPAGATSSIRWAMHLEPGSTGGINSLVVLTASPAGSTTTIGCPNEVATLAQTKFFITTAGTAGTVQFQWAQGTATATNTTLLNTRHGFMRYTKLA